MVVSIVLLTISLVLTFGNSLTRIFDSLKLRFSFCAALQILCLIAVILPNIKLRDKAFLNMLSLILYALPLIYVTCKTYRDVRFWSVVAAAACCQIPIVLIWSYLSAAGTTNVALICSAAVTGVSFLFGGNLTERLLSGIYALVAGMLIAVFSPLHTVTGMGFTAVNPITVNAVVYTLFMTTAIFHFIKRKKGYVKGFGN